MLNMLKCKVKCIYHMSIDQVTISVIKSFSDLHVLKLFSNLFHKLSAWYANDLRPKFEVWHFGRRIFLSECKFFFFFFFFYKTGFSFFISGSCYFLEKSLVLQWLIPYYIKMSHALVVIYKIKFIKLDILIIVNTCAFFYF